MTQVGEYKTSIHKFMNQSRAKEFYCLRTDPKLVQSLESVPSNIQSFALLSLLWLMNVLLLWTVGSSCSFRQNLNLAL
jgi:hypothetical protein